MANAAKQLTSLTFNGHSKQIVQYSLMDLN